MLDFSGEGIVAFLEAVRASMLGGVGFVAFDIDAERCAGGAGAGQAEDDAGAAGKEHAHTLMLAHRFVDRIVIGEVVCLLDLQAAEALAGQGGKLAAEIVDQAVCRIGVEALVVMAASDRP